MPEPPVRFVFGLHVHQPVGNFDHVFAQHQEQVYRPLLDTLERHTFFPVALHVSGPLLDWLDAHDGAYLDRLARLGADGKLELLLAGYYEPILAALPRADRVEQIGWLRERLRRRLGVEATGLWLTERVWSPELPADLADAGVAYAFVDDHHFLVSGFDRAQLHSALVTEAEGKRLSLLPIDERLRYLVPFRPPAETGEYLETLHREGRALAVLADDGEKFGGWPGTHEWVYEKGWFAEFIAMFRGLEARGIAQLVRPDEAARETASGLAYLPTASYREMEAWALPPEPAARLARLEHDLGAERVAGPDGALLRGSHWRHFLVKYPEANRMHKAAQRLSLRCRAVGNPAPARRAIGRAQCNDAYWHGVFGGLYLPHLRAAIWTALAEAEATVGAGAPPVEGEDFDCDGQNEIVIRTAGSFAVVSPARGGSIELLLDLAARRNLADTLTRRFEVYHRPAPTEGHDEGAGHSADGAPSIHAIERGIRPPEGLAVDRDDRAVFQERILPADLTLEQYASGDYQPVRNWVRAALEAETTLDGDTVVITLRPLAHPPSLSKTLRFGPDGAVTAFFEWDPAGAGPDDRFSTELSLAGSATIGAEPHAEWWRHPIETVAKSERGLDRTVQGESVTLRWPASLGHATVTLRP